MDRKLTARFYRVKQKDKGTSKFSSGLKKIGDMDLVNRERTIDGVVFRVERINISDDVITGEWLRIQKENLPSKAAPERPAEPLDLPEGYGLGHSAAFLYLANNSTLIIEQNRFGLSALRFCEFVCDMSVMPKFEAEPVLRTNEMRRLAELKARKLLIKVAEPQNLNAIESEHVSTKKSLKQLISIADGAWVEVKISMGRNEEDMNTHVLQSIVTWLLGERESRRGKISQIKVEGHEGDEDAHVILDFIKAQLKFEKDITLTNDDLDLNYRRRQAFLRDALKSERDTLDEQFGVG